MPLLDHDRDNSETQLANVIFGFDLLCALGRFANGLLCDRFGPCLIVSFGALIRARE